MSYKNLNISASATAAIVGEATKARVRIRDGVLQLRFTNRTSLVNLPKDEQVRNIGVKGSGRRIGLPSAFTAPIAELGKVALVPGKYGWFTVAAANDTAPAAASVSA